VSCVSHRAGIRHVAGRNAAGKNAGRVRFLLLKPRVLSILGLLEGLFSLFPVLFEGWRSSRGMFRSFLGSSPGGGAA